MLILFFIFLTKYFFNFMVLDYLKVDFIDILMGLEGFYL